MAAVDPADFRRAASRFASGIVVVSTSLNGVGHAMTVTAASDLTIKAMRNVAVTAGGLGTITTRSDLTTSVGGAYHVVGKSLTMEGENLFSLLSGSADVKGLKNGDMTITGSKISVKASGDLTLKGSKIAQN